MEILHFEFMRNALLAGMLASLVCAVIGTLIVVNRLVFIAGGIAHAAYGGIGLAFFFRLPPALGAAAFSLVISSIMAQITYKDRHRTDTLIGVLWAAGMALGIILIDLAPGYNVDLMSYLFGSILVVSKNDLLLMMGLSVLILTVVLFFYKDFLALSFDEEFARASGVPVRCLYFILLAMIAVSVIVIIRIVGLILVMAFFTIPPYLTEKYAGSLKKMMAASFILNLFFTFSGLWLAYRYNLTSGATIILTATVCFFIVIIFEKIRKTFLHKKLCR